MRCSNLLSEQHSIIAIKEQFLILRPISEKTKEYVLLDTIPSEMSIAEIPSHNR